MRSLTTVHRALAIASLATVSLAAVAPDAFAGHGWGHSKKYRRYDCSSRIVEHVAYVRPAPVVEVHSSSCGGSALAGFVGGLALGVVLTSATGAHASAPPAHCAAYHSAAYYDTYGYEDPYCHERFSSLDLYLVHARRCDHPRVVRVIDARDGACVRVIHYDQGQWEDWQD